MSSFSLGNAMKRQFLFVCALLLALSAVPAKAERADQLTECLTKAGAVMYSAWWCPYCLRQLQMIDPAFTREDMKDTEKLADKFPFVVECADPKTGQFTGKCPSGLRGVPAWRFSDGTQMSGMQPLEALSAKTSCAIPRAEEK
ncbi:MAG: hypothetical protein A3C93_05195 [Candidatus Lloydbacteria bacterium RIFCSPHIGHO2_02_FULL_54_17]|uniref:Thioredoxin domain-containing protein n=1 Tax=Candidatus Lloydbacteria bacterium RIFCSPHIGHO2_02_FULL_54_17 TaxID=1798664 RepID=A0A1G2DEU5_9BACT|nr:MAG: hypothetical protein A2762_05850 [Candidatus Lloydbacteria bacterium RIFCSPHIGHO2_01_FULL_54_11]OGZ11308.1 MAG: hypothetical protein A3C93_05195 [Candidatus Lloydbacteria bacterium RIFCSPHIGHO2_02_FULL_54_17]OGZ13796.1 MAG: hypothetical protein A2948_03830 [Candidatus Lloydbacteria bacterium RIFCSPLOWO2_01_FULL_54_18]OGZ16651.1 MAG: hypothetical protein A3H76_04975 [Candidatus Lloydbacteria bacterium RIFCSPLOWO2_02_FULL_54_12]